MATQTATQYASISTAAGTIPLGSLSAALPASLPNGSPAPVASPGETGGPKASLISGGMGTVEGTAGMPGELSLIPEDAMLHLSAPMVRLPVGLEVMVPVREFRVRNLLAMAPGEVIETRWGHGEDVPLSSGDVQLAWTEFEVVDGRLAVRVTRLA
jgi:hypothetical protein